MPNPKCASCSLHKNRGKLLKCMHSVCVLCLPKQITFGNALICPSCSEITPPPPGGFTHLQILPDSVLEYEPLSGGGRPHQTEITPCCDDCVESEKAVSTCVECKMNYCHDHADSHPKSRATYRHTLVRFDPSVSADQVEKSVSEYCPLHPTQQLSSFCSCCSQLLCQQCQIIHPLEHKQHILLVSDAASQAKLALNGRLGGVTEGDRSSLDKAFDRVVETIQDLHNQTEAVSADVTEYFDGLVKVIRKRENEVLNDLDQLRSKKLLPLEAQRSRLGDTISASSTATSYLNSRQSDTNFLKMYSWLEEVADKEARRLQDDGAPCASAKLVFTPNTNVDMVDVVREFGNVADVVVPSSQTFRLLPTPVSADEAGPESIDQTIFDSFNPAKCHADITLSNDNQTATAGTVGAQCVLGATSYTTGQHDIRIRLDDMQDINYVVIGMTSNTDPPLDEETHSPGLSAWDGDGTRHFIPSSVDWQDGGDVGQEWENGDILHLHLDCQQHTLSAHHERTGKTHTMYDVTGELRLFVSLWFTGHKVSII